MLLDRDDDGSSRYAARAVSRFEAMGYRGLAAEAGREARERREAERALSARRSVTLDEGR